MYPELPLLEAVRLEFLQYLGSIFFDAFPPFFQGIHPEEGAVPGAVVAIQSSGDFLGFNPHLHILCSDGCFYGEGMFRPALVRLGSQVVPVLPFIQSKPMK